MATFFKRLKFWWMEKKIATLEKSLCQGIAIKGETSRSIANRQKNVRTEAISTVEFPA